MKLVVNVDLNDFFCEEEGATISEEIKSSLIFSVKQKVLSSIQDQVKEQIEKVVKEDVEKQLSEFINKTISDEIDRGYIRRPHSKEEILISDYIKSLFHSNHGWNNPESKMKKIAADFGNELKAQYNNIFATKIVQNIKEQGFLKDDVAKLLLGDSTKNS